jgi:hypothetical protein
LASPAVGAAAGGLSMARLHRNVDLSMVDMSIIDM